ncbi:hypothetical protein L9F63_002741, partial [Diploptera punctata]
THNLIFADITISLSTISLFFIPKRKIYDSDISERTGIYNFKRFNIFYILLLILVLASSDNIITSEAMVCHQRPSINVYSTVMQQLDFLEIHKYIYTLPNRSDYVNFLYFSLDIGHCHEISECWVPAAFKRTLTRSS